MSLLRIDFLSDRASAFLAGDYGERQGCIGATRFVRPCGQRLSVAMRAACLNVGSLGLQSYLSKNQERGYTLIQDADKPGPRC